MRQIHLLHRMGAGLLMTLSLNIAAAAAPAGRAGAHQQQVTPASSSQGKLDHSGRKRVGKASYYSRRFAGRKMADGTPMKPRSNNAASKSLPLGTTAKVTNLETGQSAPVTIRDRGPYVPGRIIDVSPSTAEQIGITPKEGVAVVEVAPIAVPQPDGRVKRGDGAR